LAADARVVLDDTNRDAGPARLVRELTSNGVFQVDSEVGKMTCLCRLAAPLR